jgi:hypothetical protein
MQEVVRLIGEYVIVRTRSAGVHCGVLRESAGTAVVLAEASRVWRWRGANSLHELALRGPAKEWTRISEAVPLILLTEAIEVLPCSKEAQKNLRTVRWAA